MSRKGACWNLDGTRKVKHDNLADAFQHAWEMRRAGIYEPYKCPACDGYHIGRPATNRLKVLGQKRARPRKQLYDEILVGKLIGIIRGTGGR